MKTKLKPGRPKVKSKKKKSEKIFVNLTSAQKNKLVKKSEEDDISLSKICILALKKAGYIM